MKKLVILLGILIFTAASSFAKPANISCVAPYDLSPTSKRILLNATGSNVFGEQVAKLIIKRQLKKDSGESFKVKVDSYSLADLKAGRFKSLDISGSNLELDGVYLSYLDLSTLCDFNYIVFDDEKNTTFFKEAFPMSYTVAMTENDINKTMATRSYTKLIREVNNFGESLNLFKINKTQVKIRNNQFMYVFNYSVPLLNATYDLVVNTDLKVVDGEIEFKNAAIANKNFNINISNLSKVLNYLNPLEFSLNILENNNTKMNVRNISIVNNTITVNGTVIVGKNVVKEHKE